MTEIDLGDLGLDEGGHLLVGRALRRLGPGERLAVRGHAAALDIHLDGWCRARGHEVEAPPVGDSRAGEAGSPLVRWIRPGPFDDARYAGAERAGVADRAVEGAVHDRPPLQWGLAARGAIVEAGGPTFDFALADKMEVWADDAGRLYDQAVAAQWDPATAIDWIAEFDLPDEVEDAVVQVMTYLIENETAALLVPARFLARLHPHFREIMQLLAVQIADEARHIEVFTRRATLRRPELGLSTVGGQASLKTLLDEPDFALASFLLSVLGEGTFLSLLWFLHEHAPDPVTRQVAKLAAQDEARHVSFGLAHLSRHARLDPTMHARLADAIARRHDALQSTAGLNDRVFDALVLLAAGSFEPTAIREGFRKVQGLEGEMDQGRRKRLVRLGFADEEAGRLSSLHTRNFM